SPIIVALDLLEIRKQATDIGSSFDIARERSGGHYSIELAFVQQSRERLARGDRLQIYAWGCLERHSLVPAWLFQAASSPLHIRRKHAVIILKYTPHPHTGGLRIFRHANQASLQVGWFLNATICADINTRMSKKAGNESRNRNIRRHAAR